MLQVWSSRSYIEGDLEGTPSSILTKRAQAAWFSGRTGCSQAEYGGLRHCDANLTITVGTTICELRSCWSDCPKEGKNTIGPCVPSRVAYEVGAGRQQTVRSPRTMYPHSQEWRRNREVAMHLPASGGEGLGLMARSEYTNACKRRHPKRT